MMMLISHSLLLLYTHTLFARRSFLLRFFLYNSYTFSFSLLYHLHFIHVPQQKSFFFLILHSPFEKRAHTLDAYKQFKGPGCNLYMISFFDVNQGLREKSLALSSSLPSILYYILL
ncbi:hypothetical protein BDA99DRAFT_32610 [Phascolomyces articulosus]|uniref:Uncharacterized protein n=1 Tax=Phascolomyces articulosus TaxID=60185 RepID=A0AAD5PFD6_9FUNG|nr:hypothetical protein BDA99DRAFT_32610 [Phascolomyces articulosus]